MSSENNDHPSSELLELLGNDIHEVCKQPRFSYTRDFLLSLSELDICKKLPTGFDVSLLSEFEDASSNSLQQHRNLGGFYSQSSRHIEYGYVQTSRLESSSNYSRGSQGKWETRSSGSSDREELQIDRDSSALDIGKHYFNQPRHLWKQTEHDGLLGKPSGYSGQATSQRGRGNGSHTLNKSNEPYQPPRSFKAAPHSWRDNYSINDETFGSSECSEDRAEEERRRRASFELMRKEQQKTLQEKQNQTPHDLKEDVETDPKASLKHSEDLLDSRSKVDDDNMAPSLSDSSRIVHSQMSASRPRVPPGFRSVTVVKNVSALPSEMAFAPEVGMSESHILPILTRDASVKSVIDCSLETGSESTSAIHSNDVAVSSSNVFEKVQASSPIMNFSSPPSYRASGPPQATEGWMDSTVHNDFTNNQDTKSVLNMPDSQDHSTSILDKLFQNAFKENGEGSSNFAEQEAMKVDEEVWSPSPFISSKFSHWFLEEKKKPEEIFSSNDLPEENFSSNNLLSQMFSNEKAENGEPMIPEEKAAENTSAASPIVIPHEKVSKSISSLFPPESKETPQKFLDVKSDMVQIPETSYSSIKPDTSPSVMTCEDLEQFILAEANATVATKSMSPQWDSLDANSETSTAVNDHASQHLRSLLHVGTGPQDLASNLNVQASEIFKMFDDFDTKPAGGNIFVDHSTGENSSKVNNIENPSMLEGLFGATFMKELQSTEAPLSAQTGSADGDVTAAAAAAASRTHDVSFSHSVNVVDDPVSSVNKYGYIASNEVIGSMNNNQIVHSHKVQEPSTGFQASKVDGLITTRTSDFNVGLTGIQLPEEESLIGAGETLSPLISDIFSGWNASRHDEQLPIKSSDDIVEQLATLNSIPRNDRASSLRGPEGFFPIHGSFDLAESDPPHRQLLGRQSSPPFVHQISQAGPPFRHLSPSDHVSPHMKFVAPDSIHYDPHHQFPPNIIHSQSFHTPARPQFDPTAHLPMSHNMPVPGNFLLHELHGFPRGALPSHLMNRLPHTLEMNPMHGFPTAHRQPNHGGLGMEMPGLGIGGGPNHPEALARLFEMELRATKQTRPLAGSHLHGSYGPEVDMGFRYR